MTNRTPFLCQLRLLIGESPRVDSGCKYGLRYRKKCNKCNCISFSKYYASNLRSDKEC